MNDVNVLMLQCPKCNGEFKSPIQGSIKSLVQTALINNTIECPFCKELFLTSKPDFYYYDNNGDKQPISFKGGFDG